MMVSLYWKMQACEKCLCRSNTHASLL